MVLLPLVGLLAGLVLGTWMALAVTAGAAALGFSLVASLTDEISGLGDPFVWGDTLASFATTALGVVGGRWFRRRRAA
jgi:hypothetical protein